jgi:hypothetical protein
MTQARDEQRLQTAIADSGAHCHFFPKDNDNWVDALSHFICEYGWIADPSFSAFSSSMRQGLAGVRQYAIRAPRQASGLPMPMLFKAPSGEGKTHMARLAARWLTQVRPEVRPTDRIEVLPANGLDGDQPGKIALFGRGTRDRSESPDRSGLAVRGMAQQADGGILIIDELGNSTEGFQKMLLDFVETGRTEPLFMEDSMTREALKVDVMCMFTAQPCHIDEEKVMPDVVRRYSRGTTVEILPIRERPEDVIPIFYQALCSYRRTQDPNWTEPDSIDELLRPDAQSFIHSEVKRQPLSASALADLVGHPNVPTIGRPYVERRVRELLKVRPRRQEKPLDGGDGDLAASRTKVGAVSPADAGLHALLDQLHALDAKSFPRDKDTLGDLRETIYRAAANLLIRYLEAAVRANRNDNDTPNIVKTAKTVFDAPGRVANPTAKGWLLKLLLLELDTESVMAGLRESDMLAKVALAISDRSTPLVDLILALAAEPDQMSRLRRLGSEVLKPDRLAELGLVDRTDALTE